VNRDTLVQILTDFAWWNFGLDEVGEAESTEWAEALAGVILAADAKEA
jgi:hypothetical protein